MGKGQKGKGKSQTKPNKKSKQMSAHNKKQLAKIDRILQHKKDRSQSNSNQKDNDRKQFDKNRPHKDNHKSRSQSFKKGDNNRSQAYQKGDNNRSQAYQKGDNNRSQAYQKGDSNRSQSFQKGDNNRSQSQSFKKGGNNKQQRSGSEWTERTNTKTKQISKQFGSGKQMKRVAGNDESQDQGPIKGNPLFKIVPQGMDDDGFAALGGNQSEEDINQDYDEEEMDEEEGDEQEGDYQEQEDEEGDDEEMNEEEMEGEEQQMQGEEQADEQAEEGEQQEEYGQEQQDDLEGQEQQEEEDAQDEGQGQEEQQQDKQAQQQQHQQQPQQRQPLDISVISLKLQQTIQILMNVNKLGGGKPRKHFIQELKDLIHKYYGYNYQLISHFLDFLNPSEMIQFFQANQTQRPLTIRTNTLKTRRKQLAQSLIQRGVNLDPLADWSSVGIKIYETKVPIGATPEYLAGHYMLQSASSLLPVVALDPQPYEKILDMASAPGGKTTYIAQLMKNTGSVFANDLKKERLRALQFNLYRLGVTNTAVTCRDGRKFGTIFPSTFDRVLLDAPCTGLGIIAKDHSIKASRLMIDIYKNSHLQKQLLLAAIDSCKINGTIVYSTCSVSPLENEEVVNYALKRRFIKIVECGIQVGEEGLIKFVDKRFHVDLKKTRRIYPHVHNMDGFYVAKLIKIGKGKKEIKEEEGQQNNEHVPIQTEEVNV